MEYEKLSKLLEQVQVMAKDCKPKKLIDSKDLVQYLTSANINNRSNEIMTIVYLDTRNNIISIENESKGAVNQVVLYPREIIKKALNLNATGMVLSHNHPSGELEPSAPDIRLTATMQKACEGLDIRLLDHIITGYGNTEYFSFLEENLM